MAAGISIRQLFIRWGSDGLLLSILLLMISQRPASSQSVELSTRLDTNQIRIGEQLYLDINVWHPPGVTVRFPKIGDTLMEGIEVLEAYPRDTAAEDKNMKISQRYRLTSFDSGFYEIPPLKFGISSGQCSDSIASNPMYLLVHSVAVDSTIYDVKSPIHLPLSFLEVFPFVVGGLALVAAVYLAVWYLRKRKKSKGLLIPERPLEPAHVIAFRELDRLREEKLWQRSEFKPYYTRLTEIIRQYIERRFDIPAMEMTSYEILDAWKLGEKPEEDLAAQLNRLLNLADLVKFAREKPLASDNEENLERAYEFVKRTVPVHKTEEVENV
jgi:hypothetical protein